MGYGKLEDRVTPSKEYLEKKLQELENGEFRAENLSEVVSKDEVDPDIMISILTQRAACQSNVEPPRYLSQLAQNSFAGACQSC